MESKIVRETFKKNIEKMVDDLIQWGHESGYGSLKVNTATGNVYATWEGNWDTWVEDNDDILTLTKIDLGSSACSCEDCSNGYDPVEIANNNGTQSDVIDYYMGIFDDEIEKCEIEKQYIIGEIK